MNKQTNSKACAHARSCDPCGRDRGVALTLLIAPTLIAAGWGVLAGTTGPTNAFAHVGAHMPDINTPPKPLRKATDEERSARAYCAEVCERIDKIAPPTMLPVLPDEELFIPEDDDEELSVEGITIGSILRDAQGRPCVYVEGALYLVGDPLGDGWVITSIDLPTRTVTLKHPNQSEPVTLSPGR